MNFKLQRAKKILPADLAGRSLHDFIVEPKFHGDRMLLSREGFWSPEGVFTPRAEDSRNLPCALLPKGVVLDGVLTADKFVAFDCLGDLSESGTSWTWGARQGGLMEALMEAADPQPRQRSLRRRKYADHVQWTDPSPTYSGMIYGVQGVLESAHHRAASAWEVLLAEVLSTGGSGVILKTGDPYHTAEWLEVNTLPG